jgi:hypothetical protein
MQIVAIVAIISTIATCAFLVYIFAGDFFGAHSAHLTNVKKNVAVDVEDTPTVERGGDAKFYSRLVIDDNVIDPPNNCEFCNKIEYTPGSQRKAGIAYTNENLDLSGYQRIVFFARGEHGGEVVSFIAIGKNSFEHGFNNTDVFPYYHFAIITKNVTLDNVWKRYQISLNKTNLADVKYPFGFVISGREEEVKQVFYLKGVTFDRNLAQDPIQLFNTGPFSISPSG